MDREQTNRVYKPIYVYTSHPTTIKFTLYPYGAIYLDSGFFCLFHFFYDDNLK